jgi:hypothetical protein
MVSNHITSKQYNTSYLEITLAMYDFVNYRKHRYTICVTFCSLMRLNLSGILLPTQGTRILGHMRQQNIIFNTDFQLTRGV